MGTFAEEDGDARAIFSNYTSGLLALTTVNSTTYSLISLIVGGTALAIAIGYLYSVSPAFQDQLQGQFQSHYRAFNEGWTSGKQKLVVLTLMIELKTKYFS